MEEGEIIIMKKNKERYFKFLIRLIAVFVLTITMIILISCESSAEGIKSQVESQTIAENQMDKQTESVSKKNIDLDFEKSVSTFALKFDKSMNIISGDSSNVGLSMRENLMQVTQLSYTNLKNYLAKFPNRNENDIHFASYFFILSIKDMLISQAAGNPPESFFQPLGENGYIDVPKGGGCPLGAWTSIKFLTEEEEIILELLNSLGAKVLPFDLLSLPSQDQKSIVSFISEKLKPENKELIKTSYWNQEIWGTEGGGGLKALQEELKSIIDYFFWSKAPEIESLITEEIKSRLKTSNYQPIIDAYNESDKIGWTGYPSAAEKDQISAMEIKADFNGNVTGTVYEKRDFSLNLKGEPDFGPISGTGELFISDPAIGNNVRFEATLEWTKWDEMGKPIEGLVVLDNKEKGYKIEILTKPNGSKEGKFFENGKQTGTVDVGIEGHSTYINIETGNKTDLNID